MQTPPVPPSTPPAPPVSHRTASIWQAGLGLLGAAGLWVASLNFLIQGASEISSPQIPRNEITGAFLMAAGLALGGWLLIPSAWFALARLGRYSVDHLPGQARLARWISFPRLVALFIVFLAVGAITARISPLDWLILPFAHVLVIGIPVILFLYLGMRGLPRNSPQRVWGIFDVGLTLGPMVIIFIELVALVAALVVALLLIAPTPDQMNELSRQLKQFQSANVTPDDLLPMLQPYLKNPAIVILGLVFMAGIVPLIEEGLKPLGVWFLANRHLTPAEGFMAGLLSGAGFALVESLGYTSSGSQAWLSTVLLRTPTALMHITACGLTGWGIAKAISQHQFRWFFAGYGSAASIHGLWNGLTLTSAGVVLMYPNQIGAQIVAGAALLGMILLFILTFSLLLLFNRRLRSQAAHAIISIVPAPGLNPDIIPSESESSLNEYHP